MSTLKALPDAIIPMTPNEDHTGKEGCAVVISSAKAALSTAANDNAFGVIVDGGKTTGKSSVAVFGGTPGGIRVKMAGTPGTVVAGSYLQLHTDGTFKLDLGAGNARAICARALEAGAANELIAAVLLPITIGS